MKSENLQPGIKIKTNTELGDTRGMTIKPEYLNNRRAGAMGELLSYVPGHGGDVWWVRHDDDEATIAAYWSDEFEEAQ